MGERKVALITGAVRGIGKEIALTFAAEGYDIAANTRSKADDVDDIKKTVESAYDVRCEVVEGDVSKFEDAEKMVKQTMELFGRIDVLVNNAGITRDGLLLRMSKEDFESVVDVNLGGTFNVTRNVIPVMVKQKGGRIISLASVVGVTGNAGQTNYSASKAGIIGFTKSLAREVASRNILVNAVAPGFIDTNMTNVLSDSVKENINAQIPLKRMGTPKDVANVIKFLASEDSSYITGQVIHIDGGMVM